MLVEYRQRHLRYTTDPTAAALSCALCPATIQRSASADDEAVATGGLCTSDLAALYPTIFADNAQAAKTGERPWIIVRLAKMTASLTEFALGTAWHLYR